MFETALNTPSVALMLDTPTGPTIVCAAAIPFLLVSIGNGLRIMGGRAAEFCPPSPAGLGKRPPLHHISGRDPKEVHDA